MQFYNADFHLIVDSGEITNFRVPRMYITAEPKGTDSTLRLQKSFGKSIQEEGVGGF